MNPLSDLPPILLPVPKALLLLGEWREVPDAFGIHGHPDYLPSVRRVLGERAGDDHGEVSKQVICGVAIEPLKNPEGYRLTISPSRILIEADDARGAANAARTLMQMLRQYGRRLPCARVQDRPAFAVRGVMLDVSRDRVPTMEHLLATIDLLASLKINHLQLYTEHTFAYRGHDDAWRGWSPITPDEVVAVDAHCRERGIELAANQNCFGHLHHWFEHPRYAPLAEIQGQDTVWDFAGFPQTGPFSLCPSDPGSIALIADLLAQLAPAFSSPLINIGCDETYDLGQGRSKAEVERRGRIDVYLAFIDQVCAVARTLGKRPMFWADIVLHHPAALQRLPEDLIGLAWDYEPTARFDRWCAQFHQAGREVWVCPGTSAWRSIVGRTTPRRANLLEAARAGIAGGARGFLVTNWGDAGHRQQWPIELNALAEAAHRGWSGEAAYDARAASLHAFGDDSLALGPWLDELGDVDAPLRLLGGSAGPDGVQRPMGNRSALFHDLHLRWDEPWIGSPQEWQDVEDRLARLFDRAPLDIDPRLTAEIMHTLEEASKTARRAVLRRKSPLDPGWRRTLADSFRRLTVRHRELWLVRSRPGGLDASAAHYERIIADLERP
ncbi:MAG: family 20 glycosylhydrolase [Planctomycetes bacterium]|nr:family 20 glycosylhydrolase [Planctomycetota bacterium]